MEKPSNRIEIEEPHFNKDSGGGRLAEFEPSSMFLKKIGQNFIEESNKKPAEGGSEGEDGGVGLGKEKAWEVKREEMEKRVRGYGFMVRLVFFF